MVLKPLAGTVLLGWDKEEQQGCGIYPSVRSNCCWAGCCVCGDGTLRRLWTLPLDFTRLILVLEGSDEGSSCSAQQQPAVFAGCPPSSVGCMPALARSFGAQT